MQIADQTATPNSYYVYPGCKWNIIECYTRKLWGVLLLLFFVLLGGGGGEIMTRLHFGSYIQVGFEQKDTYVTLLLLFSDLF